NSLASAGAALGHLGDVSASASNSVNYYKLAAPNSIRRYAAANSNDTQDRVEEMLSTRVFVDANLESQDGDTATYLMHGSVVCEPLASDTNATLDPNCAADLDKLQLRVRATLADGGIDLHFLFGPSRLDPVMLAVRNSPNDSVAIEVELAALKQTITYIETTFPTSSPSDLPAVFAGRVRFSATVNGTDDVTFAFSVLTAVSIADDASGAGHNVSIGAADPMMSARIQGALKRLTLTLSAAAADIVWPYADFIGDPNKAGTVAFHLGGASFNLAIDDYLPNGFTIDNIGLGGDSTTLRKDGQTLLSVDLNANQGRKLSLGVAPDAAQDSAVFTVTPAYNLVVSTQFHHIQGDLATDFPTYFLNDTYTMALAGSGSASFEPLPEQFMMRPAQVLVKTGTLSLSASSDSASTVTVGAGQCLVGVDEVPQGKHLLLGHFQEAVCQ
ncbi:MAG TPA: hypothetical protein VFH51_13935, partial [Myxococcota bacterium]|nr:hypothetical protein [Myxococcota bacterium]